MAYDVNTDYSAIIKSLKEKQASLTDQAEIAALQAQIEAAEVSRVQKIASNTAEYGKWADDATLDKVFNYQAEQSLNPTYDRYAKNINKSYDESRQNASNEALSRGMARSSYAQDRLAGIDQDRASALSDIEMQRAQAITAQKNSLSSAYQTDQADKLAQEKSEYASTIGAYSNNYQAEINKIQSDGDASNDWKIPYLQAARNEKIANYADTLAGYGDYSGYQAAGYTAEQTKALETAAAKAAVSSGGSGGSSSSAPKSLTLSQAQSMAESGIFNSSVLSTFYAYGMSDTDIAAMYPEYSAYTASTGTGSSAGTLATAMTDAQFDSFLNSYFRQYSNASSVDIVNDLYTRFESGSITEAQLKKALSVLGISA